MDKATPSITRSLCASLQNPPIPIPTSSLGTTTTCDTNDAWRKAHAATAAESSSNHFRNIRAPDSPVSFLRTAKLCGARNRRQPLHTSGDRTKSAVATHNRSICNRPYVESGSRARSPASGPLRTVHAPFGAHGSSLNEGIFRHPVTQLSPA
jgi:hypothetical protein